jgi:N-methylhydantoinase A
MGGTSTDVALIQNGKAQTAARDHGGDVMVRASSIDVRTVGAGGGSIAYVPALTKALRVGPQSAGAAPGPAAYCNRGGTLPTVTDANVVLGYLPSGDAPRRRHADRRDLAEAAVQSIADASRHQSASRPPKASSISSTRTCTARCAWSRSSRVTIRATSR